MGAFIFLEQRPAWMSRSTSVIGIKAEVARAFHHVSF